MNEPAEAYSPPSVEFMLAFQRFVGEVFRLNGQLLGAADRLSKDLELSASRWQAIGIIHHEPLTVAAISRRLSLSRQSIQQTVNRLNQQGIIEFVDNPDHRTSPLVQLTAHGREIREILVERQAYVTALMTDDLAYTVDDLDQLTSQLQQMRKQAAQVNISPFVTGKSDK